MRPDQRFHIAAVGCSGYSYGMNDTFTRRLIELQKDPGYFNPQKLEKLKIVFDRVCQEMDIVDIKKDQRKRDRLATIILVGSKMYPEDDARVRAAVKAMHLPSLKE